MEGYRWKAAVVTLSDKGYKGEREDRSGPLICEMLTEAGYDIHETVLLPDEREEIEKSLRRLCDIDRVDIIFTTGGDGFRAERLRSGGGDVCCREKCSGHCRGHEACVA